MIMIQGSDLDIINLKFLLLCFESLSGLTINFDKSEVMVLGYPDVEHQRIADNLNCTLADFPITYLGFPIRETRVLIRDLAPLVSRFPGLFAISSSPAALVAEVFVEGRWNILFRRYLGVHEAADLVQLRNSLPLDLSSSPDSASWRLQPSGEFSLLRDRLPSGVEVAKRHGPGTGFCPLCGTPETCSHIMFSCLAARALWSFVQEALGPAWQARELGEFLQTQANRAGGGRRLFWLVFAGISWTLWNVRNKMVIEKTFPSRVTDPVFSFLGFLQQWSPLVRQRDRSSFDDTLRTLRTAALPLSASAPAPATSSVA
uniref:Uncharacterized protein n=1 Tax=Avena sativa TaxID=4498 RepID=A0ACD5YRR4_AVESA